jgi:aspartyl-tRNA(Asn)/glutamyl-tRNA(Gln) amidotransferase subunit C
MIKKAILMSIDSKEINDIAWLARLATDAGELDHYRRDLDNILELVQQMNKVNTDGVSPLAHPLEITARLRPDEVTETDQRERFQAVAPSVRDGLYLVPKVIE